MPRLKLTLEYDGEGFAGWQVQPSGRSIQGDLEAALSQLLDAPARVDVAGRTDAGVHALGQVACFDTERSLPPRAYLQGLNGLLPKEIAVVAVEEVKPGFDPRRQNRGKIYR